VKFKKKNKIIIQCQVAKEISQRHASPLSLSQFSSSAFAKKKNIFFGSTLKFNDNKASRLVEMKVNNEHATSRRWASRYGR
jgi:hypothetical protein